MELYAPYLFTFHLISGNSHFVCRRNRFKILRNSSNGITVAHPYLRTLSHTFEQHIVLAERSQVSTSILTGTCRFYFATIGIRHKLCTIADAQNGVFTSDFAQINLERTLVIHGEGASRQNHSLDSFVVFGELVIGDNLAIRIQLAHPATDKLRGL